MILSRASTGQLSLASLGVAKSSTSFGWGKGRNVTSAGWQVTRCDPMWHVSSHSGVATLRTAIHFLLTYLLTLKSSPVLLSVLCQCVARLEMSCRPLVLWQLKLLAAFYERTAPSALSSCDSRLLSQEFLLSLRSRIETVLSQWVRSMSLGWFYQCSRRILMNWQYQ